MRTFRNILLALGVLLITIPLTSTDANAEKLNKTYNKEFSTEKGNQVTIENRFGQVNIENWDKNAVSITVEVTVEHNSADKAQKMLDAINVTIEKVGDEIKAVTEIDEKAFRISSGFNFSSSSKEFSIDYNVKMPKDLNLDLYNKFGDAFINEITGHADIKIKYGNLKANRIFRGSEEPLSSLTLGYGDASIEEVDWMKLDIKYANLSITNGKALVLISKYSKISVENASSLVVESKYDGINIGNISNIVGESGYTTYKIGKIGKKLSITTRYGDVKVQEVAPTLQELVYRGSYASLSAPIPASVSYQIDATASYGGLSYNSQAKVSRIENNSKVSVNGIVGSNENTKTKVSVTVKYGSANLD